MKQLKILIVEDEALIALQLEFSLVHAGYEVCGIAGQGEHAIQATREKNPDVILMDIRLPGRMDGIEAAQQIGAFSPAVVIFTTGYADLGLKQRAMALNPAAYLTKPVAIHQINAILEPMFRAD